MKLGLDRWAFESEQEQKKLEADAADDKERQLNAAVDWHDFACVGEITFDGDDVTQLPALVTVAQVRALARMQAAEASGGGGGGVGNVAGAAAVQTISGASNDANDMDMDMDADNIDKDDNATTAGVADAGNDDHDDQPVASADIDATNVRASFKRDEGKSLSRAARVQVSNVMSMVVIRFIYLMFDFFSLCMFVKGLPTLWSRNSD